MDHWKDQDPWKQRLKILYATAAITDSGGGDDGIIDGSGDAQDDVRSEANISRYGQHDEGHASEQRHGDSEHAPDDEDESSSSSGAFGDDLGDALSAALDEQVAGAAQEIR